MAFDPKSYLAETESFDPKAYLAEPDFDPKAYLSESDDTPGALEQARLASVAVKPTRIPSLDPGAKRAREEMLGMGENRKMPLSTLFAGAEQAVPLVGAPAAAKEGYKAGQELLGENIAGKTAGAALGALNVVGTAFNPLMVGLQYPAQVTQAAAEAAFGDTASAMASLAKEQEVLPDVQPSMSESVAANMASDLWTQARKDPLNTAMIAEGVAKGPSQIRTARKAAVASKVEATLADVKSGKISLDDANATLEPLGKKIERELVYRDTGEPVKPTDQPIPKNPALDAALEQLKQPEPVEPARPVSEPAPPVAEPVRPVPDDLYTKQVDLAPVTTVQGKPFTQGVEPVRIPQAAIEQAQPYIRESFGDRRISIPPEQFGDPAAMTIGHLKGELARAKVEMPEGYTWKQAVDDGLFRAEQKADGSWALREVPKGEATVRVPERLAREQAAKPVAAAEPVAEPAPPPSPDMPAIAPGLDMARPEQPVAPKTPPRAVKGKEGVNLPDLSTATMADLYAGQDAAVMVRQDLFSSKSKQNQLALDAAFKKLKRSTEGTAGYKATQESIAKLKNEGDRIAAEWNDASWREKDPYHVEYERRVSSPAPKAGASTVAPKEASPPSPSLPTIDAPAIQQRMKVMKAKWKKTYPRLDPQDIDSAVDAAFIDSFGEEATAPWNPTKTASPETFLETVVKNKVTTLFRKSQAKKNKMVSDAEPIVGEGEVEAGKAGIAEPAGKAPSPLDELMANEEEALYRKDISELPPTRRKLMEALADEKTVAEAALDAGVSVATARNQIDAARALLKEKARKRSGRAGAVDIGSKSMGPGAASIEESLQDFGIRQFGEKVVNDPTVPDYVKKDISLYYEKKSRAATLEEADQIIAERGIEEVSRLLFSNDPLIPPTLKPVLGFKLASEYNRMSMTAKAAGDMRLANEMGEREAAITDSVNMYGTVAGQTLKHFDYWPHMSPEGKAHYYRRTAARRHEEHASIGDNKAKIDEIGKEATSTPAAKDINSKVRSEASKALSNARRINRGPLPVEVEQAVAKLTEQPKGLWDRYKEGAAKGLATKLESLIAGNVGPRKVALDGFTMRLAKNLSPKSKKAGAEPSMITPTGAIREALVNQDKYEQVWNDTIKKAKEDMGKRFANDPDGLADATQALDALANIERVYSNEALSAAVRDRMTTLGERVVDMASRSDPENLDLATRIANSIASEVGAAREPGLKAEAIEALTTDLRDSVLRMVNEHRINRLNAMSSKGSPVVRAAKSKSEQIIEAANRGELTHAKFYDIVAEKLGLPKWSPEISAEIRRLASLEQSAAEGAPKIEALNKLNAFIANNTGWSMSDVWLSNLYPSVLSGVRTQEANFVDTGINVLSEMIVGSPSMGRAAAPAAFDALTSGVALGARRAGRVLQTGITPFYGKYQTPRMLESARWGEKGGLEGVAPTGPVGRAAWAILKPILESKVGKVQAVQKYVPRAMMAGDTFWYSVMERWAVHAKLYEMAKKQGYTGKDAARWVAQTMEYGADRLEIAKEQAAKEGYRGNNYALRVQEIVDQGRNPSYKAAIEQADDLASRATYNHRPEGTLGKVSDALEAFKIKYPSFTLAVMFTRIPANVFNRYLNYTPWGYVRAFKGFDGVKPSPGEAAGYAIKATAGVALTAMVARMEAEGKTEVAGSGPDDPERKKQLLATGWRPYHIKIPGTNTWVNYMLTPPGLMLAIYANARDAMRKGQDKQDVIEAVKMAMARIGKTALDQSFLSQTARLVEAVSQGSVSAYTRLIASTGTSSIIPMKSLLNDIQLLFDNKRYGGKTLRAAVLAETPFAKMAGNPDLNAMGQPVRLDRSRTFKVNPVDRAWKFVVDNEAWIPVPPKSDTMIGDRYITPDEYYRVIERGGPKVRQFIVENMDKWSRSKMAKGDLQKVIASRAGAAWLYERAQIAKETGAMNKPPLRVPIKPVPYDE